LEESFCSVHPRKKWAARIFNMPLQRVLSVNKKTPAKDLIALVVNIEGEPLAGWMEPAPT